MSQSATDPLLPFPNTHTYTETTPLTSIIAEEGPLGIRGHWRSPDTDWLRVASVSWTRLLVEAPVPEDRKREKVDTVYQLSKQEQSRRLPQYTTCWVCTECISQYRFHRILVVLWVNMLWAFCTHINLQGVYFHAPKSNHSLRGSEKKVCLTWAFLHNGTVTGCSSVKNSSYIIQLTTRFMDGFWVTETWFPKGEDFYSI